MGGAVQREKGGCGRGSGWAREGRSNRRGSLARVAAAAWRPWWLNLKAKVVAIAVVTEAIVVAEAVAEVVAGGGCRRCGLLCRRLGSLLLRLAAAAATAATHPAAGRGLRDTGKERGHEGHVVAVELLERGLEGGAGRRGRRGGERGGGDGGGVNVAERDGGDGGGVNVAVSSSLSTPMPHTMDPVNMSSTQGLARERAGKVGDRSGNR